MSESAVSEKALELLRGIRAELKRGTEHYSRSGIRLNTIEEVLQCLLDEGGVFIKPPDHLVAPSDGVHHLQEADKTPAN